MWLSTTKYFSPSFSYTTPPQRGRTGGAGGLPGLGPQVEPEVLGRVLRVGDHDGPVIQVDHAAVVGGHVLLELRRVEVAGLLAEGFGDLVVDHVHTPERVDPDHRRQRRHPYVG